MIGLLIQINYYYFVGNGVCMNYGGEVYSGSMFVLCDVNLLFYVEMIGFMGSEMVNYVDMFVFLFGGV